MFHKPWKHGSWQCPMAYGCSGLRGRPIICLPLGQGNNVPCGMDERMVSHVPKTLRGYVFCSFGCTSWKILGWLEIPGGHSCILLGSILYTKNIIIAGGPDIQPDIFESWGNGSGRTFQSKWAQKHVFWIRNEGDTAVLSSAQFFSTWHFQLYTRVSSYFMAGLPGNDWWLPIL